MCAEVRPQTERAYHGMQDLHVYDPAADVYEGRARATSAVAGMVRLRQVLGTTLTTLSRAAICAPLQSTADVK